MVVSKGCAHDDWIEIARSLKERYSLDYVINRIMVDKGILKFLGDSVLKPSELTGKWRKIGKFHLKLGRWSPRWHNKREFS